MPPIFFNMGGGGEVRLSDALDKPFEGICGRDDSAFGEGEPSKTITVRIQVSS